MIPEAHMKLLNQVLNPTEVEYRTTNTQKQTRDVRKMQDKLQEARGDDPGEVRQADQNQTKQKTQPKEPLTDELARFDDFNIDYPQESHLRP